MSKSEKKKKRGSSRAPSPAPIVEIIPETTESRQRRAHANDPEVAVWCAINGISHDKFVTRGHLISRVEAFQARLKGPDLSTMRFFTGLTELCIIFQPTITSLNGLQYAPNLMTLWINECGLKSIGPGLKGCRKLKALHLCANKIRSIEHLDNMPDLEVLWLCENKITQVEGLKGCPKLRVLWLASNRIQTVSTGLDGNTQLAELNLADNLVGEFKQVLNLSRCETLRTLSFSDPHYGDNPLCNLCNYQTYVLYHLGQLTTLDSMYISRESKQLAEATYMKKKMYYNMRIKTLKRNANNVIRMAHDAMQVKAGHLSLNLNVLLRQRKDLSRILEERVLLPSFEDIEVASDFAAKTQQKQDKNGGSGESGDSGASGASGGAKKIEEEEKTDRRQQTTGESSAPSSPTKKNTESATSSSSDAALNAVDAHERELYESPEMERAMRTKLERIDDAIQEKAAKIEELAALFVHTKRELNDVSEESISRLIIELETGGNIRLEDGKPSDVWYTSCEDLLLSRFFATDFRAYNIGGLRVHRVTRIHNRFLRNRFDAAMEKMARKRNIRVASADSGGKRNLEYLFFGEDPRLNRMSGAGNELLRIPERGFRTAKEFRLLGMDESVTMSNSVSEAHLPSIRSFLSDSALALKRQEDRATVTGSVLETASTHMAGSGRAAASAAIHARAAAASAATHGNTKRGSYNNNGSGAVASKPSDWADESDMVDAGMLRKAVSSLVAGHFVLPDGKLLVAKVFLGNSGSTHDVFDGQTKNKQRRDRSGSATGSVGEGDNNDDTDDDADDSDSDADAAGATGKLNDEDKRSLLEDDSTSEEDDTDDEGGLGLGNYAPDAVVRPSKFPGHDAVYRLNPADPKQRNWYVFNHALVLPEYMIEFELESKGKKKDKEKKRKEPAAVARELFGRDLSSQELVDIRPMLRPLERFHDQCDRVIGNEETGATSHSMAAAALEGHHTVDGGSLMGGDDVDGWGSGTTTFGVGGQTRDTRLGEHLSSSSRSSGASVLSLPPHLPSRPKLFVISPASILKQCRTDDFCNIVYLNLHGCSIRKIEVVGRCVNCRVLVLTFNEIHKIEGIDSMERLERLELGFNLIKRVEGLRGLSRIEKLELNNNLLYRVDDVRVLRESLPSLVNLDLRNNALCDTKTYTATVLSKLPLLTRLDGKQITTEEREEHVSSVEVITKQLIRQYAKGTGALGRDISAGQKDASTSLQTSGQGTGVGSPSERRTSQHSKERPNAPSSPTTSSAPPISPEPTSSSSSSDNFVTGPLVVEGSTNTTVLPVTSPNRGSDHDPWWLTVESLDLNHRNLQKIENLSHLKNLRRLSLADNEITQLEGLEMNTLLEELVLEENRILKLEGLFTLQFLKKLDLGKNKLVKLENLENLVHLTQLSIEDNQIESLSGLQSLTNLMELYMCSNRIMNVKEVQHLKTLPKLIIVDLSGNRLCRHESYRLYCVYYLRKLKVLDGIGVDINEQQSAREKYSGKLTAEFLAEKIGHKYFEHIRELDLSSCRIREIEHLSGDEFSNLRELNLDNNMLTSIGGLHRLDKLTVLRLNHNRIRKLGSNGNRSLMNPSLSKDGGSPEKVTIGGHGLSGLPNLEILQLGYNHVTDLGSLNLHMLAELKVLFVQGNDIVRVEGLNACYKLRELVMDKNRIKFVDADGFSGLTNLRELRLEENGLRSLSNFNLPNLQSLYLGLNRVNDLAELDKLSSIPFLMELSLNSNPVARKQLYRANAIRRLPTLKFIDGREVTYEERERVELMFVTDNRAMPHSLFYVDNAPQGGGGMNGGLNGNVMGGTNIQGMGGGAPKAAIRLTAVNFETLSGFSRNGNPLGKLAAKAANSATGGLNQHGGDGILPKVGRGATSGNPNHPAGIPQRRVSANALLNANGGNYQARRPDGGIVLGGQQSGSRLGGHSRSSVGRSQQKVPDRGGFAWRLRR